LHIKASNRWSIRRIKCLYVRHSRTRTQKSLRCVLSCTCPQAGARITSNSWGTEDHNYSSPMCFMMDAYTWAQQDTLHVFAAGELECAVVTCMCSMTSHQNCWENFYISALGQPSIHTCCVPLHWYLYAWFQSKMSLCAWFQFKFG
jgi:hypothetical protein